MSFKFDEKEYLAEGSEIISSLMWLEWLLVKHFHIVWQTR